jgi:hypothetical protein
MHVHGTSGEGGGERAQGRVAAVGLPRDKRERRVCLRRRKRTRGRVLWCMHVLVHAYVLLCACVAR